MTETAAGFGLFAVSKSTNLLWPKVFWKCSSQIVFFNRVVFSLTPSTCIESQNQWKRMQNTRFRCYRLNFTWISPRTVCARLFTMTETAAGFVFFSVSKSTNLLWPKVFWKSNSQIVFFNRDVFRWRPPHREPKIMIFMILRDIFHTDPLGFWTTNHRKSSIFPIWPDFGRS